MTILEIRAEVLIATAEALAKVGDEYDCSPAELAYAACAFLETHNELEGDLTMMECEGEG